MPIGIFEHQGKWYTLAGPTHVTLIPMDIKWTGIFTHYDFSKAPLFHDKLARNALPYSFLRDYSHRTSLLEERLDRMINYTISRSTSPDLLYDAIIGSGHAIGDGLKGAGEAFEHLIKTDVSVFDSWTNGLGSGRSPGPGSGLRPLRQI